MNLSIVIPAYNEEDRLGGMLEAYGAYFARKYGEDVELIVVVNGSRDDTEGVARRHAETYPHIRIIVEPAAIGKGGAIMLGTRHATGELVGFVDADGATPPEAFDDLVRLADVQDVIIASRWVPGAVVNPPQPLKRRIVSRIFNILVRILFGFDVRDTQCGAKLIRGEAMKTVLPQLGLTRWAFDVDLLFQLHRAGYRIHECPTEWHDVEGSRLRIPRASLEMFLAICRLRLLYSRLRWVVGVYDATIGRISPRRP